MRRLRRVLFLVLFFGSSSKLAAAYGIASLGEKGS